MPGPRLMLIDDDVAYCEDLSLVLAGRFDVTANEADRGVFKVPSLRNVGLRPRLMHNGRFTSFARVLDFYSGSGGEQSFGETMVAIHWTWKSRILL